MAASSTELFQVPLMGIRHFTTTAPPPPPSTARVLNAKCNLFGSPDQAETDQIFDEENQKNRTRLSRYGIRFGGGEQHLQEKESSADAKPQSAQMRCTIPVPAATTNRSSADSDAAISGDRENRKPYSKQTQLTDNFKVRKTPMKQQHTAKCVLISSTSATLSPAISTDSPNSSPLPSPPPHRKA